MSSMNYYSVANISFHDDFAGDKVTNAIDDVDAETTKFARRKLTTTTTARPSVIEFLNTFPALKIEGQGALVSAELQRSSSQKQSRPLRLLSDMQTEKHTTGESKLMVLSLPFF